MKFLKLLFLTIITPLLLHASEKGKKTPEPGSLKTIRLKTDMSQTTNIRCPEENRHQQNITNFLNSPKARESMSLLLPDGRTRLMYAVDWGTPEMVAKHFDLGAHSTLHATDTNGFTATHRAAAFGKIYGNDPACSNHALEVLYEHGADIYAKNKVGITPLLIAVMERNHYSVDILLELMEYDAHIHQNADRALDCLEQAIDYSNNNNRKFKAVIFTNLSNRLRKMFNRKIEQPHEIDAPKKTEDEQDDLEMMKEIEQKHAQGLNQAAIALMITIRDKKLSDFKRGLKDRFINHYFTSLKDNTGCTILMFAAGYGTVDYLKEIHDLLAKNNENIKNYLTQENNLRLNAVIFTTAQDRVENLCWFLDNNLIDLDVKIGKKSLMDTLVYQRKAPKCLGEIIKRHKKRNFQKTLSHIENCLKNFSDIKNPDQHIIDKHTILQKEYAKMKDEYNAAASKTGSGSTDARIARTNPRSTFSQPSPAQAFAAATAVATTQTAATAGNSNNSGNTGTSSSSSTASLLVTTPLDPRRKKARTAGSRSTDDRIALANQLASIQPSQAQAFAAAAVATAQTAATAGNSNNSGNTGTSSSSTATLLGITPLDPKTKKARTE